MAERSLARGDLLDTINGRMIVTDVLVMPPPCATFVTSATKSAGFAAEKREREKTRKYASAGARGYRFVPLVVESFGCLGAKAMPCFLDKLMILRVVPRAHGTEKAQL